MSRVQLRDYQERAVQALREGIKAGCKRQVLVAPTGSGKTEMACAITEGAHEKGARTLFIVDRVVLVDQTSERFDRYKIPHGVIQAGHWRFRTHLPVQVCSAQTIERRGIPDDCKLVFVDEAHCMRRVITDFLLETDATVIGLTATPFAKGMGQIYNGVVNVATMNQLVEQGYLVPLKMYAAKHIDMTGAKVVAGEWAEKEIESRGLEIVGDIVSEWVDKTDRHFGGPVKTIVFSATVDHGAELCRQFREAGYDFRQISYKDGGEDERRAIIEEFRKPDSTITGLISCEVFTKGFDCPDVLCGISARPYRKSLSSHIQQLGRVMRSSPGKEFGLWLDHSGNVLRFRDDVADIFANGIQDLDDGKREAKVRKEPTEKERVDIRCSCGYVMQGWEKVCPGCGKERKHRALVETVPGEMVEINLRKANQSTTWDSKVHFMGCLKTWAIQHNYKSAWVAHKYREKFGVWPNDHRVKGAPPCPISPDVRGWIVSQAIRYAKRRAA